MPPAITTATLTKYTKDQVKELYSSTGDYAELKRRGLDLLVHGILTPLVTWCQSRTTLASIQNNSFDQDLNSSTSRHSEELSQLQSPERESELGLLRENAGNVISSSGSPASGSAKKILAADDPTQFEFLKQKKQQILEGVARFNFKPKKVRGKKYNKSILV